jgi:hypothetical protein
VSPTVVIVGQWEAGFAEAGMNKKAIAVALLMSAMWVQSACAQDAEFIGQNGSPDKTQAKATDDASAARTAAGCGPNEMHFDVKTDKTQHPQAPPDAARAVIYIFSERISFDQTYRIGMDGKWMGATHDESYFFFAAEPGEHRLCWDVQKGQDKLSDQGAAVTFTAEAGKAYFFRTTMRGNNEITLRWRFERIDAAEGMFMVSSRPLSTSRPRPQKED